MGVYLSPWDRNYPKYGTTEYSDIFINMMKEVVKDYGPFFEFWWDRANGEGPNGKKQVYDWHRFEQIMQTIAPNIILFSDIGPDARWVNKFALRTGKINEHDSTPLVDFKKLKDESFNKAISDKKFTAASSYL